MKKILVTGGSGYIGSHTIIDLLQNGFEVISADNFSRSSPDIFIGIEKATGVKVKNYAIDLCNFDDTHAVFQENPDLAGIIHFAAFKAVGESVETPLLYFENNLVSLLNILKCAGEFKVPHFVFSSSCTVYGNPKEIPVTENSPFEEAESSYGYTKQMGENIVTESYRTLGLKASLLRYFNPVGAHPSNEIGEIPIGKPANLVPAITQTAIGKLPEMKVHGNNYPTRDGSCIRDYIHVSDIAHAHTLALKHLMQINKKEVCEVFNLGSGTGYTVLEVIAAFEKVSGRKLKYSIGPRRRGDVVAIFANNDKAKNILGWNPVFNLDQMMATAWNWELKLQELEIKNGPKNFN
ncbi:MAG: UDP-glucose 4-epimerase GalE [Chitinophagaceae bacterium]|nr:UDP-glucose 4-epimerase GalE [Bacteroidota bacterium]MCC6258866.1 UDP-glucose 4-epimerase GalE [Chitinophagaceae bacterium]MCW5916099.1 UDP-glucose 4-epimerase GalE [Ferruginibacter sp.]